MVLDEGRGGIIAVDHRRAATMHGEACQWPEGCNMGAFRLVSMPEGERWLCLRHAGRVWNARKAANRAAGRCACGAEPSPGFKTCERCRKRNSLDRRRARAFNARAAECGIRLPRQAGRRRAFLWAYCEAFKRSQRAARRRWHRAWARGSLRSLTEPFTAAVSVPWEGHTVTVEATFNLSLGGMRVAGVPDRRVPTLAVVVAPGDSCQIWQARKAEKPETVSVSGVEPACELAMAA